MVVLMTLAVMASVAYAGEVTAQNPAIAASSTVFAKKVVLRGTLGDQQVQLTIRPKEIADEGLEGEYFVFGHSLKILLAGDIEDNLLFMEESENGTDISGQWDGKLTGDHLSGSWMSADGSVTKPFSLTVVPAALPHVSSGTAAHIKQ